MAQERRVLLANGQYITIVQTTGTSSGDVMSQSAVTAALNAKSDVGHTHNTSAITGGTFGTNMIADGAITTSKIQDKSVTLAKLADNVPISTTSYETVTVSGLTSGGTAAVGAEVTIGGASYKFDSTGVVFVQIPYGQIYKVQAYSNNTWLCGYIATYTANTPSRSVSIIYNNMMSIGVFIEATDGTLYASSDWNSSKTPNSIVVANGVTRFRVALTQKSSMPMAYNNTIPFENYMIAISGNTEALSDYDGAENTAKILKLQPSVTYAAGYCSTFTFPDGSTKGFVPSMGQLYLVYQNMASVDAALTACGGTAMKTYGNYWSSTFRGVFSSERCCYELDWRDGRINGYAISVGCDVRPFAAYY